MASCYIDSAHREMAVNHQTRPFLTIHRSKWLLHLYGTYWVNSLMAVLTMSNCLLAGNCCRSQVLCNLNVVNKRISQDAEASSHKTDAAVPHLCFPSPLLLNQDWAKGGREREREHKREYDDRERQRERYPFSPHLLPCAPNSLIWESRERRWQPTQALVNLTSNFPVFTVHTGEEVTAGTWIKAPRRQRGRNTRGGAAHTCTHTVTLYMPTDA